MTLLPFGHTTSPKIYIVKSQLCLTTFCFLVAAQHCAGLCVLLLCVCEVSHPAMLLVEMLLARLLCELKMLGCLRENTTGSWSSGVVTVDQRSRDEEDDVDEKEDAEDVARDKHKCVHFRHTIPAIDLDASLVKYGFYVDHFFKCPISSLHSCH